MFCAQCGERTLRDPCGACGRTALLEGRYRLESVLGKGAVGTTWKATEIETGRVRAIKEVSLQRVADDKARELLEREAAILRQLSHPMIPAGVESFFAGEGKGRGLYIVQEFIDGVDLSIELARRRYQQEEVLDIAEELLEVLGYLHSLSPPVIHRDLKPRNIMRRRSGALVLIDFGSVRDVLKDRDLGGSTVAGTFGYMAPEQLMGEASPRSDLYALGATLVALLSRQDPQRMMEISGLKWRQHVDVHPALERFLDGLLAPEPRDRFSSAAAAQAAIRQARADLSRPAAALLAPTPPPSHSPSPMTYVVFLAVLLGVLLTFAMLGGVTVLYILNATSEAVVVESKPILSVEENSAQPESLTVGVGTYPPLGDANAPVKLVVFSDFQCPFCARLVPVLKEIRAAYPDEVVIYFRDYPLSFHKDARGAHALARCAAEQGQFWPAHDLLLENHDALTSDDRQGYAQRLGLDLDALGRCQQGDLSIIDTDIAEGKAAGAYGAPNSFVNGIKLTGAQPMSAFKEVIDAELERLSR